MTPKKLILSVFIILFTLWFFSMPASLFDEPYSTIMFDKDGILLNARVADDAQWRFPQKEKVPENYIIAVTLFEDQYFRYHPGVNPFSIVRAIKQNITPGKNKSGASTITMQLVRLSRKEKRRTIKEKIIEIWLATRLELAYSKKEILELYASHAPFGGNIVGIQAASWRYFGHPPHNLSWAEAALLAVLPNSPGLIYPGRNQHELKAKRNRLLERLHSQKHLDDLTLELSLLEPIPEKPRSLPQKAPHLFDRSLNDGLKGTAIQTTIDGNLQVNVKNILLKHYADLRGSQIHNMAALVADVNTGNVLAYWGNTPNHEQEVVAGQVDVISSLRSPGSLLKPFLFAGMLQEGQILPTMLIPDIPTHYQGFKPENFSKSYDGAVPANRAISRSLNIPAVRMLKDYHPEKFLSLLKSLGFSNFTKPASHYGLSIILGGGEVTLYEISGIYASMARTLNYWEKDNEHNLKSFYPLSYLANSPSRLKVTESPFKPGVLWHTFEAMLEAARPDTEANWQRFKSNQRIAWKTGTSFGNRDAWAIGVTSQYMVAIWAGNATGEGRPSLTGISAAAPAMFDIFGILPSAPWFPKPYEDLKPMIICRESGYPASEICPHKDTLWAPFREFETGACKYHKTIHTEKSTGLRVTSNCALWSDIETNPWFVLPPAQAYYFKQKNPFYKPLPPFKENCFELLDDNLPMQWIYPTESTTLFIPIEIDGSSGQTILRVAHNNDKAILHWHIDNQYIGSTENFHEMPVNPDPGIHKVTITDDKGYMLSKSIQIVKR
jgi:penicillin-binding protein 1C